jgi:hypothetical protein
MIHGLTIAVAVTLVALLPVRYMLRRDDRRKAIARHPGNYDPASAFKPLPVVCPVCGLEFAEALMFIAGDDVTGWIRIPERHECAGRWAA